MGEVNSKYNLDLTESLNGLRELGKLQDDFTEAMQKSKQAERDFLKKALQSTSDYDKELLKSLQTTTKASQANQSYASSLKEAAARTLGLGKNQAEVNQKLTEAKKKQADLNAEMDKSGKKAGTLSKAFSAIKGAIVGAFAVGAIVDFGKQIIAATSGFQKFQASVRTMLGDKQQADILIAQGAKFAASTPFELTEIQDATKKLLAFNISARDIESTLKAVGNVASGIGAPIGEIAELYGKAKVQGRLFGEDINQLTGRGIPIIQELAKQFGVTDAEVKKLVEEGKVGFPQLEKAFVNMTSEGGKFFNLMEDQAATTGGQISNLNDGWGQLLTTIGNGTGGLINGAVSWLNGAVGSMNAFFKGIQGLRQDAQLAELGEEAQIVKDQIEQLTQSAVKSGKTLAVAQNEAIKKLQVDAEGQVAFLKKTISELRGEQDALPLSRGKEINAIADKIKFTKQEIEIEKERLKVLKAIGTEINTPVVDVKAKEQAEKDAKAAAKKAEAERLKAASELAKEIENLEAQAAAARLDLLDEGSREYIEAIYAEGEKEINALEQMLRAKTKLTAEQEEQLGLLREVNAQKRVEALIAITRQEGEENKKSLEEAKERSEEELALEEELAIERVKSLTRLKGSGSEEQKKAEDFEKEKQTKILAIQIEFAEKRLQALAAEFGPEAELKREQLKNLIRGMEEEIQGLNKGKEKKFDLYKLLGLDLDGEQKKVLEEGLSMVKNVISDALANEIQANEQRISSLNGYIQEKEQALSNEIELNKLGFASNVEGKRAEIEELEKQRAKAIADQRRAQRLQLLIDTTQQASSMITASANIFKTLSPIPFVGVPLAIALIGTMFGAFIAAKTKAFGATQPTQTMRKGGLLEGPSHEQGGIKGTGRFGHIEVEGGEFVINKKSTSKYRDLIESINKENFPKLAFPQYMPDAEMNVSPRMDLPKRLNKLQTKVSEQQKQEQRQLQTDLKEVKGLLKAIAISNDRIPEEQIIQTDEGILYLSKNKKRLVRKLKV